MWLTRVTCILWPKILGRSDCECILIVLLGLFCLLGLLVSREDGGGACGPQYVGGSGPHTTV